MMMYKFLLSLGIMILTSFQLLAQKEPVKVGVVGLTHTHVHWILGREDRGDIQVVGIVEPNRDLAKRYSEQHGFPALAATTGALVTILVAGRTRPSRASSL